MPTSAPPDALAVPQWTRMRVLASAAGISAFGSYLNMVALGLFAYELTGSALRTGVFMALRLGTGFVTGPLAAALVTRLSRRSLMMCCDLASATGLVALVLAPGGAREPLLYGLAILLGAGQTTWGVASKSAVPDLVGQDGRVRANGIMVTARSGAILLGFAASGAVTTWWGSSAAFLIDAGSYGLSALLLSAVPLGRVPPDPGEVPAAPWRSTRAATLILAAAPVLAGMVAVRAIDAFGSASHNVGLPIYSTIADPERPAVFAAVFTTAWAAGSLGAGRLLGRFAKDAPGRRAEAAFAVGTCVMSVFFVLSFTGLPLYLLVPVGVVAGLADGFTEIAYTSRLQAVDGSRRAHLLGFAAMTQYAGMGLGSLVCAWLMEALHPLPVVALAHGVPVAFAAVFLVILLTHRTRTDSDALPFTPSRDQSHR